MRIYPSLDDFYEDRGGARSGEREFGVMWRSENPHYTLNYRVAVVHDTGDIYAARQSWAADRERVLLLGTVDHIRADVMDHWLCGDHCAYVHAEELLEGWADHCTDPNSLAWICERLGVTA